MWIVSKRVTLWRRDARARGVVIGPPKYRCLIKKPRGLRLGLQRFVAHWPEMVQCLEARPDQSAVELLIEFQVRYPGFYSRSHLRTRSCPRAWCTSCEFRIGWTRAQLTTADSRAG